MKSDKKSEKNVEISEKSNISKVQKTKKFFKKKKPEEEKDVKIIVNLTKSNWQKVAPKKTIKKTQTLTAKISETDDKQEKFEAKGSEKQEIWFDVDKIFIPTNNEESKEIKDPSLPKTPKITKVIAIDCEMVGIGEEGRDSMLARVSIVNQYNQCIYDKFVLPTEKITDYRTSVSGIRPGDLKTENGAIKFETIQKEVAEIIKNKILVGHAIHNDLKILLLDHPRSKIRDTQKCKHFRTLHRSLGGLSSLKNLAKLILGIDIQSGEHSSIQDAQCAMRLFTMYRKEWNLEIITRKQKNKQKTIENDGQPATIVDNTRLPQDGKSKHQRFIERKKSKRGFSNKK
jgi:hypothetical protein